MTFTRVNLFFHYKLLCNAMGLSFCPPASTILCLIDHFPIDEGSQALSLLYVLEIVLQEVAIEDGQIG